MRFVDEASITVRSGKGGNGSASLKRAKNVPKGGPDGGDGGKGGDVIFRASPRLLTLYDFRAQRLFEAENGDIGRSQDKYGRSGEDLYIDVPVGTQIFLEDPDREGYTLLADLRRVDQEFVACPGGEGGRGNLHFKSSVNRAPKRAEAGKPGQEKRLRLELKVIADAGPARPAQRGQVHLPFGGFRRAAQDRLLPLHDAHAQPWAWWRARPRRRPDAA